MSYATHDDLLTAALEYAADGIPVFPTRLYVRGDGRKGVSPIADWDNASTTDPDVIRGWWLGQYAGAAVCIDTGKAGLVGVDQDVSDGQTGPENWEALEHAPTARVKSPSGGFHDYYKADIDHLFTVDNTGAVAPGVDIRGMGGFLFAPPSVDPRGGSWVWEAGGRPDWDALPVVPEVVVKAMAAKEASKRRKPSAARHGSTSSMAPELGSSVEFNRVQPESQLFGGQDRERDFGPDGGFKSVPDALALLNRERLAFEALTEPNSGRSHILSQRYAVLAGHGVPSFWSHEKALEVLMASCEVNGFTEMHGERYAEEQARRGLEFGMLEPWHPVAGGQEGAEAPGEAESGSKAATAGEDAVAQMMAKLLDRDALEALPDPEPLVEDLLDLDSESWIIGASGGFKSFVALDIACHVARGMPWRGKPVKRGEVIYIVAEGAKGIRKRIQAWEKTYGGRADGVLVLPEPVQSASGGAKAGVGPEWRTLVEVVRRRRPVMVVIDTQARVTVGLNENDNGEMSVFVMAVTLMRQAAGSCVLVVHHTGRNGGDARGASAIDAAQDTELKVSRPESASKRDELTATILMDKQKDGADKVKIEIQLAVVTLAPNQHTGKPMTSLAILPGDAWSSALFKSPPLPDWRIGLDGYKAEVVTVMEDHAGENGATQSEIITWIAERRKERDDTRPVVKSSVSTAVKNLCGEFKNADGSFSVQVLERHGVRLVMRAE